MNFAVLLGLLSTLLFGLRHGIDYDHIAAITDITSTETDRRSSMKLGLLYALGHGVVVLVLGSLAVLFGQFLPHSIDAWMERFVGITLIALGVYVCWNLLRTPKENFAVVSRFKLISQLAARARSRLLRKPYVAVKSSYTSRSAF